MRNHGATIRPGRSGDAEGMSVLHYHCWQVAFVDLVTPRSAVAEMQPLRNLERFQRWLASDSDVDVVVAEIDGEVAGYAAVSGHELLHLFIEPAHAGRGLGRLLLADAEQRIAAGGHDTAELHTMFGNEAAIGLYVSAGWEITEGVIPNDHDGVQYDEHVLIKRLG